jgi:hypothetical protein
MKNKPYRENACEEEVPWAKTKRDALRIWAGIFGLIFGVVTTHFYYYLRRVRQPDPPHQCADVIVTNGAFNHTCDPDQSAERADYNSFICRCKEKK